MNFLSFFFQIIFFLCFNFIINGSPNDTFILSLNTEQNYTFYKANSTYIIKFQLNQNDKQNLKKYFIHIYEYIGDISLYGLKCINNFDCDLNNNNIFNHFKNGNLIFSNKVNNNINLYISLDKIIEEETNYLIFPVICNQIYNKCSFNIGIYNLNDDQLEYPLNYNQEFYFKIWNINTKYIIKNDYLNTQKLMIEITFFSGKCNVDIKSQYIDQIMIQKKIISNIYKFSVASYSSEKFDVVISNQILSFESFYKIKYYFSDFLDSGPNSLGIVTNNELCAYMLEDNKIHYLNFTIDDNHMKYINAEFQNTKYFILIYAVNCEIQIEELNTQKTGFIQLFEKEYDINNKSEINKIFKIAQKEDAYSDYPRRCLIYASSFMANYGKYIYVHSNEKIGFKFTENIKDISFRYITIFTEDKNIKNNPYLEVIAPPSCEILLKIYIYKEYNHLLKSKKIRKRDYINLYEASKICNFDKECIIIAQIFNFKNYSSNESLKSNYEESVKDNKGFVYIQYLNNFSADNHIQINKLQKELSIESITENSETNYIYQVNHETKYELFIHFENQPKELKVYVNDHSDLMKIEKNGRFILKTDDRLQLYTSFNFLIKNGPTPTFFTYYLRRINNILEIIANENIYGYFSEEEKYLNYEYTFEENITSFNLEIFTSFSSFKIKDITGDNQNCCNFSSDFKTVIQNELIYYVINNNTNLKSLYKRKILITFSYAGKSENNRFIRFRILPIYFLPNIIYLNQGEEAICLPNKENKICYFYFKVPIGYNREGITVYGYYERIYSKVLPLYIKLIEKNKIVVQDFIDFYNNKDSNIRDKIENSNEILSYVYFENLDISPDNYIIGFFETDGTAKIRLVYSISFPIDNEKKLIVYPGIKKYYTITKDNCPLILEIISKDPYDYGDYRGFLTFIKVNKKLRFLVRSNGKTIKKTNVEEEFTMELDKDFDKSRAEYLISTSNDGPCTFYLYYEIKRKNESIYHVVMNKPFILYLNNYTYPLRFYMRVIENVREIIMNFKFTEQNYFLTKNMINIQDYDLNILLGDSSFIFNYLYLNEEEIGKNDNKDGIHEHFISDLYLIEYLTAEQTYLISFKNKNNITNEILDKYKYLYFSLKPKNPNNLQKEEIKIQIITIRQDNQFFIPAQNKYFYTYINYPSRLSNNFTLVSDSFENMFIISISSEEIKYLQLNYTYSNIALKNKSEDNLMQGQKIIYIYHEKIRVDKKRNHLNISLSLKDEYIQKNIGKGKKRLYYTIKYTTKDYESLYPNIIESSNIKPLAEYVFNKRSSNKQNFIVEYDNVNDVIKSRWSIILNKTYQYSYVEARYYLRYFDISKVDNDQYNLSIFPMQLDEKINLLSYVNSEECIQKVNVKEFNYKVLLLAYFEDESGEEIILAYKPQKVSHEFKYFWFWILGVILVLALFIFFSVLNLCLKIKEERDYYEKEKEINLNSFSNEPINKEEEDKIIKLD